MHVYDLWEPYLVPLLRWDSAIHHASLLRR